MGGLLLSLLGCKQARAPEGVRTHAPIIVGSDFRPKMTRYVRPVYPEWARKEHIEGTLEYTVTIGKDGEVRNLSFVSGPRLLAPYAEAAVRQWRYEPALLNGLRVEVKTVLDVEFTLRQ